MNGWETSQITVTKTKRFFYYTATLVHEIRSLPRDLSSSFYKLLKTFIFARAWAGSASE